MLYVLHRPTIGLDDRPVAWFTRHTAIAFVCITSSVYWTRPLAHPDDFQTDFAMCCVLHTHFGLHTFGLHRVHQTHFPPSAHATDRLPNLNNVNLLCARLDTMYYRAWTWKTRGFSGRKVYSMCRADSMSAERPWLMSLKIFSPILKECVWKFSLTGVCPMHWRWFSRLPKSNGNGNGRRPSNGM